MGLACAWRLARSGAAVTLFEARACGEGATLASLGALWPASPLAQGPLQELHRESLWQFEDFARELAAESGLPVAFRRLGRLEFLNSAKAVLRAQEESVVACARWPGFAGPLPTMQLLDRAGVSHDYPALVPQPHGALLCRATAQVNVRQLVAALRTACVRAGVTILESTAVTSLEFHAKRVIAVRTAKGSTTLDAALVTAGAWSAQVSPAVAAVAAIRPVKGQAMRLLPPAGVRLDLIIKSGPTYLIPWDDEILLGSTTEPDAGFDESSTPVARENLLAAAAGIFPPLAEAKVLGHWAGLRPQTPAKPHAPIMGPHPEIPNLYLCTGHYKTGIGLAPLVSDLMNKLITQGSSPGLDTFRPGRSASGG